MCSGIIGNDGRHYILDLLRTFPPDVNFLEVDGVDLSKEAKALGKRVLHCAEVVSTFLSLMSLFPIPGSNRSVGPTSPHSLNQLMKDAFFPLAV